MWATRSILAQFHKRGKAAKNRTEQKVTRGFWGEGETGTPSAAKKKKKKKKKAANEPTIASQADGPETSDGFARVNVYENG